MAWAVWERRDGLGRHEDVPALQDAQRTPLLGVNTMRPTFGSRATIVTYCKACRDPS